MGFRILQHIQISPLLQWWFSEVKKLLLNYNSNKCNTKTQQIGFGSIHRADTLSLPNDLSADQQTSNDRAQQHPPVPEEKELQGRNENMKTWQSQPF